MLYRIEAGKIHTNAVEFAAADHCNLRCAGCSHMSPFVRPRLPFEEELTRDMVRLASVMVADEIRILGGEPLLNPRIVPILKAAKECGVAKRVVLTTNGLLLHRMQEEFWAYTDEVRVSLYPGRSPTDSLLDQARKRAAETGTRLVISEYSTFRVTMVTEPHPADAITAMIFRTCKNAHLYHCHLVHQGWLYKCSCPAYLVEYLEKTAHSVYRPHDDGFDIHGATDLREQLWHFLSQNRTLDACRHCLGYVGDEQRHHQLSTGEIRGACLERVTRRTHLNGKTLAMEFFRYLGRRTAERLTGKSQW